MRLRHRVSTIWTGSAIPYKKEAEIADADGNAESRGDSIPVFSGAAPVIQTFAQSKLEFAGVGALIAARVADGVAPHEIGVFVRSDGEIARARAAVELAGFPYRMLDERVEAVSGFATVGTVHLAKVPKMNPVTATIIVKDIGMLALVLLE